MRPRERRQTGDDANQREQHWLWIVTLVTCLGEGAVVLFLFAFRASLTEFAAGIPAATGRLWALVLVPAVVILLAILMTVRRIARNVLRITYVSSPKFAQSKSNTLRRLEQMLS